MDLPWTALPSWPHCGYYNAGTRPFLAVHRSAYELVPRLYLPVLDYYTIVPRHLQLTSTYSSASSDPVCNELRQSGRGDWPEKVNPSFDARQTTEDGFPNPHMTAREGQSCAKHLRRSVNRRSLNCATTVAYGTEITSILPCKRTLGSVSIFGSSTRNQLRVERIGPLPPLAPIVDHGRVGDILQKPVLSATACHSDGLTAEPARVAFGSRYLLTAMNVGPNRHFTWMGIANVEELLSVSFNKCYSEELLVLDAEDLRLLHVDRDLTFRDSVNCDIWPIKSEYDYFKAELGSHPRVAILSSQAGLHRLDFRSHSCHGSTNLGSTIDVTNRADILFNVWTDWRLNRSDKGIFTYEQHPRMPFWSAIGTQNLLAVLDERMPRSPLLEWSSSTTAHDESSLTCVASLNGENGNFGDVILSCTPSEGTVCMFHAHNRNLLDGIRVDFAAPSNSVSLSTSDASSSGLVGFGGRKSVRGAGIQGSSDARQSQIPVPTMLWSDLPLSNIMSFAPSDGIRGITMHPHTDASEAFSRKISSVGERRSHLTCIQLSNSGVVIGQLVACGAFCDDEHSFEYSSSDAYPDGRSGHQLVGHRPERPLSGVDETWALREAQVSHGSSKSRAQLFDLPNEGIRILGCTSKLHYMNVIDLRKRLSCDIDDDGSSGDGDQCASGSFPRPYVSDRSLFSKLQQQQSGSERSSLSVTRMQHLLQAALAVPRTLSEVAEVVRTGNPHAKTPLKMSTLHAVLQSSPHVSSYTVRCAYLSGLCEAYKIYRTDPSLSLSFAKPFDLVMNDSPFNKLLEELEQIYYKK